MKYDFYEMLQRNFCGEQMRILFINKPTPIWSPDKGILMLHWFKRASCF